MQYKKVYISSGHGGTDSGAVAKDGTQEADIVLDIAKRVVGLLPTDLLPELVGEKKPTGTTILEVNEKAKKGLWSVHNSVLVDLHCDWSGASEGTMCYVWEGAVESERLGRTLVKNLAKVTGRDKGIKDHKKSNHGGLGMISDTAPLAVVLEIDSLRADIDPNNGLELLKSEEGKQKLAEAIAQGIKEFVGWDNNAITAEARTEIENAILGNSIAWHRVPRDEQKILSAANDALRKLLLPKK